MPPARHGLIAAGAGFALPAPFPRFPPRLAAPPLHCQSTSRKPKREGKGEGFPRRAFPHFLQAFAVTRLASPFSLSLYRNAPPCRRAQGRIISRLANKRRRGVLASRYFAALPKLAPGLPPGGDPRPPARKREGRQSDILTILYASDIRMSNIFLLHSDKFLTSFRSAFPLPASGLARPPA